MANMNKNLLELKPHLEPGETIKATVFGAYEVNNTVRNGIMVATDKRVVFFAKKLFGYDMEVFPYSNTSSIEMSKELMGHRITFFASGNRVSMKWINKGDVNKFIDITKSSIGKNENISNTSISSTNSPISIPEQIKQLSELKDSGIITDTEFNQKKSELLSRM